MNTNNKTGLGEAQSLVWQMRATLRLTQWEALTWVFSSSGTT